MWLNILIHQWAAGVDFSIQVAAQRGERDSRALSTGLLDSINRWEWATPLCVQYRISRLISSYFSRVGCARSRLW